MNIADTKQALADAITGVANLNGYASKPKTVQPGDAFVRWGGWERAAGSAYEATFRVIIVLPQTSEDAADLFAYAHADAIEAALSPLIYIDGFAPSLLPTEVGDLLTLTVTGRTE